MGILDYIWLGILEVFTGSPAFVIFGLPISITLIMVFSGFLFGIAIGATPGLAGPMAMAVSLPILISVFGFEPDALLPVLGFLIGIMKGATVGGAVPAILFNTPGTPDALLTTYDGYPMTQKGDAKKALKVAHFSSASGDTFSDIVLFVGAPFLAVIVEAYLDFPEKTALIILSLAFIASVVGNSPAKGLLSMGLGMLVAYVGTGQDFYPRLSFGTQELASGFPVVTTVLGVLILGEVFKSLEDMYVEGVKATERHQETDGGTHKLSWQERKALFPYIANSAVIGTAIGALPGIGSTLAATLGYASGKRRYARAGDRDKKFGEGVPQGVAATEAANSAVSGANLIPVLSLGIPGNAAAVFLILATDTIGGFNPGPSVFRFTADEINPELVFAFGIFTTMVLANLINWTIGGHFMQLMSFMVEIPKHILMPSVLLVTLTAIYVEETSMIALVFALGFGFLGYLFRKFGISVLPFIIAFLLAGRLEETGRQAFAATGQDPFFLFTNPLALAFMIASVGVVILYSGSRDTTTQ